MKLNLDLREVKSEKVSALEKLISQRRIKPKRLLLTTYNFTRSVLEYLNALATEGVEIIVVAAILVEFTLDEAKFPIWINKTNHSKIWIIDNDLYIGSTNLSGDGMKNLMIKVSRSKLPEVEKFIMGLRFARGTLVETTFI